ncbi:MAG TPA: polyprenol monophosphomannose synthase [Aggregatilineales bacterium]|nr:polyprenol monophosphomannose synthase [Aggregatilineales bacterium]
MPDAPKTIIVVPTYNEKENLANLTEALLGLSIPNLTILIVDDNSPDGTGRIADELTAQTEHIQVMHRTGKKGLGTAYTEGFIWAINEGADYIVQMDADFSHDPKDVPRLLAGLAEADLVIGSRYTKGGKLDERWSFQRRLLSWWANRIWVDFILGTRIKDATAGFRAWRRNTLIGMNLATIRSNGYVFQVEMSYLARKLGYTIREIPIYFQDRRYGESKMGFKVQYEAAVGVFRLRRHYGRVTPADRAMGG